MAGVQAGRLSIEIVAEIARLQQDLDKAKRAVKSMSGDIARDTRAANDNLSRMGTGFERTSQRMVASAGAQRAGMQQLTMQIGDMATMYSLGARPQQIFASQLGQTLQAIQLMSGGTSKFAAFMGGPWGAAITAGTLVLAPFVAKLFEAEEATKKVEFASNAMGDAQSVLGGIIDMNTGRIKNQSGALLALARAQILVNQVQAQGRLDTARSSIGASRHGAIPMTPRGGPLNVLSMLTDSTPAAQRNLANRFLSGEIDSDAAVRELNRLRKAGTLTASTFNELAAAYANAGVEVANLKVWRDAEAALNGNKGALGQFLSPKGGGGRASRSGRGGQSEADIAARFAREMEGWTQRNLQAQMDLATSVEERVELQKRSVEWDRKGNLAEVAAQKDFSEEQKQRLVNMIEANNALRLEIIERDRVRDLAKEAAEIADVRHANEMDALQNQIEMSGTESERKMLALQIFDAEQEYLRQRLQAVITANTINGIQNQQAKLAQLQLDGLVANSAANRGRVDRQNETAVERYLRDINKTPAQINEAIDQIKMDGLDKLNDGLVEAITGVKSLGDVFKNVAADIIADLLRIQIQRAIIGPLAKLLFPSMGDPVDLLSGTPFGGARAMGGPVRAGSAYLVGEEGPEIFTPHTGGSIIPNGASIGGGGVTINIDAKDAVLASTVKQWVAEGVIIATQRGAELGESRTMRRLSRPGLG